jgi:putative hydrolase of the HAD superfamily
MHRSRGQQRLPSKVAPSFSSVDRRFPFVDNNESNRLTSMPTARGLLFDYGGTLVEEVSVDPRAGNEWLLARASYRPAHVTLEDVLERANRVTKEVAGRRDDVHLETAWPTLTRLIHDYFGIHFDTPVAELELGFWKASVKTRPIPGAREALEQFHQLHVPAAVVSNTSFGEHVIRYELAKHGLTDHLAFVMVSSEYSVRKPNVLLFETAAARLAVQPKDIWFMGDRLDTDVVGAKAAGMTAVWFNPNNQQDPSQSADLTVADWDTFTRHVLNAVSGSR